MARTSAGILMYRRRDDMLSVLLVHQGGPFWRHRDAGSWSIPKGEYGEGEDPLITAIREFEEELGIRPIGTPWLLGNVVQKGGKHVVAYALEGEADVSSIKSNLFALEWPPRSGQFQQFPEVDRAEWFAMEVARERLLKSQLPLLDRLEAELNVKPR